MWCVAVSQRYAVDIYFAIFVGIRLILKFKFSYSFISIAFCSERYYHAYNLSVILVPPIGGNVEFERLAILDATLLIFGGILPAEQFVVFGIRINIIAV